MYLLQFAYEHNENIIDKISKPKLWEQINFLFLSHDSINQLNVVRDRNKECNGISSLWDILDKTCTTLGKKIPEIQIIKSNT